MSLESRLKKIEEMATPKEKDTKVDIYIVGDEAEFDYWGNKIVYSKAEFEEIKKTWTDKDTIINVMGDDDDDY